MFINHFHKDRNTESSLCYSMGKVIAILILEIIILGVVAAFVLIVAHETKLRSHIVGIVTVICHVGTFASCKIKFLTLDLNVQVSMIKA